MSTKQKDERIVLFGHVDRRGHRLNDEILSEYPAYYFEAAIEKLKEQAEAMRDAEENQTVPYERLREHRERRRALEGRISMIEESVPRLSSAQRDKLERTYRELGQKISESMPDRSKMLYGQASARQEMRKNVERTERIDPELAESCGIRLEGGKATMNDVTRAWKIIGKVIGAPTNPETLRKDRAYGTYHLPVSLEDLERE